VGKQIAPEVGVKGSKQWLGHFKPPVLSMGKFYITAFAGFPFEPFLNYTLFGSSHSAGWFHN